MKILDVPQSGSLAGQTSSRNRFGQYRRTRAIPVNPATPFQGLARSRMALAASVWRTLTAAQRAGWETLGLGMTRTDSLGQAYTLSGFLAFVSVNSLNAAAGTAQVVDAPALTTPAAMLTSAITLTVAAFSVAYTPTPLAAGEKLFSFASPQGSAGRSFCGDYRLVAVSAAAAASPANIYAAYVARFGIPIVGQRIFVLLQRYSLGFLGGPLYDSAVVA